MVNKMLNSVKKIGILSIILSIFYWVCIIIDTINHRKIAFYDGTYFIISFVFFVGGIGIIKIKKWAYKLILWFSLIIFMFSITAGIPAILYVLVDAPVSGLSLSNLSSSIISLSIILCISGIMFFSLEKKNIAELFKDVERVLREKEKHEK